MSVHCMYTVQCVYQYSVHKRNQSITSRILYFVTPLIVCSNNNIFLSLIINESYFDKIVYLSIEWIETFITKIYLTYKRKADLFSFLYIIFLERYFHFFYFIIKTFCFTSMKIKSGLTFQFLWPFRFCDLPEFKE